MLGDDAAGANRVMTIPRFAGIKGKRKLSVLTAYDFLTAQMFDEAGIDAILVGDTLGMVVQGHRSTLPVTLDQMVYHGEIVARAVRRALVIVDLPFLSYHASHEQAVMSAGRILKETQAACVKLEGGVSQAQTIRALVTADIPVMAHVGLRPQAIHVLGGMSKIQRDEDQLLRDAHAAEDAGAFAIVLELIPRSIAARITRELKIPTIGIGAGPDCDGQVLVSSDMLGQTTGFSPRFLKKYADLRETTIAAAKAFHDDVVGHQFPTDAHSHE